MGREQDATQNMATHTVVRMQSNKARAVSAHSPVLCRSPFAVQQLSIVDSSNTQGLNGTSVERVSSELHFRAKKRTEGVYAAAEAARLNRLHQKLKTLSTKDKDGDVEVEDVSNFGDEEGETQQSGRFSSRPVQNTSVDRSLC